MGIFRDSFNRSALETAIKKTLETDLKKNEETTKKNLKALDAKIELLNLALLKDVKSKTKKVEISTSIQLLIFDYLGILRDVRDNINDNSKTASLLSVIFNKKGAENIRKKLSDVGGKGSELYTIQNLTYIKDLFEQLGLDEPLKKVKKDLDNKLTKIDF